MSEENKELQPENHADDKRKEPKGFRKFLHFTGVVFAVTGSLVLAFRYFPNDRIAITEPLIWLPALAYTVFLPFFFLLYGWKKKLVWFGIVFLLFLMNLFTEQPLLLMTNPAATKGDGDLQLIMWNTMSHNRGKRNVLEGYQEYDSDFLFLLEGTFSQKPPAFLTEDLSEDYDWYSTHHMVIASKHEVLESQEVEFDSRLRVFEALVSVQVSEELKKEIWLILVDLPSPPRADSRACFKDLDMYLSEKEGSKIITGDFNTPRSSGLLNSTMARYQDAYLMVSDQHWLASFPDHLPFFQIDHTFFTRDLHPTTARLISGSGSDHFRQVVTFSPNGDGE